MGVYIKCMEMPIFEHQSWGIRKGTDGKWYMVDTNAETSDGEWHEIVPVPPHGRLIEKNAVFELIRSMPDVDRLLPVKFMKALYELPTVIEAEEET